MEHILFTFLVVVLFSGSVLTFSESDYPNIEVPGLASPLSDFGGDNENLPPRDPAPCCFPQKWQGNMTAQTSAASRGGRCGQLSSLLYVDSANHRIAGSSGSGNGTRMFRAFFNATANVTKIYIINPATQKCFNMTFNKSRWRNQCLPQNATFVSTFSLGPASGGLSVNMFTFGGRSSDNRHGQRAFLKVSILVSPVDSSTCLPVLIQNRGQMRPRQEENEIEFENEDYDELDRRGRGGRGGPVSGSAYFSNLQASIPDESVFNIPTYCNPSQVDSTLKFDNQPTTFPDVLERFIDFY